MIFALRKKKLERFKYLELQTFQYYGPEDLSILGATDLSAPLKEQDNKTIKFRLYKIIAYLCQFRYEIVTSTDCHKKYPLLIVFYVNFNKKCQNYYHFKEYVT